MFDSVPSELDVLDRIRLEMKKHLREKRAPEDVHDFLVRHWARLMTGIFMAKGNTDPDWQAGWDTVNALLWTLAPKQSRADTMKMLRILPVLLARLHEGCTALNYDLMARDRLFADLALLHASIAREGLHLAAGEALPEPSPATTSDPLAGEREMGLLRPAPVETESPSAPLDDLPVLRVGDWVSFNQPQGRKRLKLTWLSPQQGMFLFTDPQGTDALSLTRARLRAKFQSREAALDAGRRANPPAG